MIIPVIYLSIGFALGIALLKWPNARYESPVGTLLFSMIGWPIFVALLGIMGLGFALATSLSLIGVEAHQSDTHGV